METCKLVCFLIGSKFTGNLGLYLQHSEGNFTGVVMMVCHGFQKPLCLVTHQRTHSRTLDTEDTVSDNQPQGSIFEIALPTATAKEKHMTKASIPDKASSSRRAYPEPNDYITKPFNVGILKMRIAKLF